MIRFLIFVIVGFVLMGVSVMHAAVSDKSYPDDFVLINEILPEAIIDLRYAGEENFTAARVPGYKASKAYLTRPAADALVKVVEQLDHDNYRLVIYDAYRPQQAVDFFKAWSRNKMADLNKDYYFPNLPKGKLFEEGYLMAQSGHSRGSTLDISIVKKEKTYKERAIPTERKLKNGEKFLYMDDGTADFGVHFDYFGEAAHTNSDLVSEEAKAMRQYLLKVMNDAGFENYPTEWWHFTLKDEPYPKKYFNFPVM